MRVPVLIVVFGAMLIACSGRTAPPPTSTPTLVPTATLPAAPPVISAAWAGRLKAVGTFPTQTPQRLAWSAGGALWMLGTDSVDQLDTTTMTTKRRFAVSAPERVLNVSPAGLVAVAGGVGAPVRLLDLATGDVVKTLATGGLTSSATFFDGGKKVLLVAGDRIAASTWDTATGARLRDLTGFQTAAPVFNVTISEDGKRAAWVARATLQFQDVELGTFSTRQQFEDFIGAYAFSPDGTTFATATAAQNGTALEGRLQLWDPAGNVEQRRIVQPELFATVAFAPKEPLIVTGSNGFSLWPIADGKRLGGSDVSVAGPVRLAAFSPDGVTLATAANDGSVLLWRAVP